jgi:CRISP-associated protein Cas1
MPALFLADPELEISLSSEHLEVRQRKESGSSAALKRRIPLFDVDRVAIVTGVPVSVRVLQSLLRRDIPVALLNRGGRLVGAFTPNRDGDANIRIRQYERAKEGAWNLANAAALVRAKHLNSRRLLQKAAADKPAPDAVSFVRDLDQLLALADKAVQTETLDELRGIEGSGSALYFRHLRHFFPAHMPFNGRSRRPPRDEANALLSWTYTLVLSEIKTAVAASGLDPCIGCLHSIGYGRPSLALDLLEPLRAPLCDLLVLRLANLQIIKPEDFEKDPETGGFAMKRDAMKAFFVQYEQRLERMFKDARDGSHTSFRRIITRLAADYLASLRGDSPLNPFLMP